MGITAALVFCNLGAAYGTAKAGVGIASVGVLKSELIFKSLIPIIMAGILGIYGLIVAVILQGRSKSLQSLICFSSTNSLNSNHSWKLELQCLQRLQAPRLRPLLRSFITRCRSRHRCCWWCWRPCQRSEGYLRRCHPYPHFRRGSRSLRFDYFNHSVHPRLQQLLMRKTITLY